MFKKRSKTESSRTEHAGGRRLGFWLSVLTAVLIVLGMIILTALPFAIEWGAEHMIVRLGAESAAISDVDFNPMTGRLRVFDLDIEGAGGDRISMENLVVKVGLIPILKKRIQFREISLTGFSIDIRQLEDGTLLFAGLAIPERTGPEPEEPAQEEEKTPWGFGLDKLDIKDFAVHLVTPQLDETVVLTHLSSADFATWEPYDPGEHIMRVDLLGGSVDVEVDTLLFTDPISLSTRIGLRELPLERIMPFLNNAPVRSLSGSISGRGQVDVTLSLKTDPAVSGTVKFDVFSRDTAVQVAREELELAAEPGALNIGISLNSRMDLGGSLNREAKFSAVVSLADSIFGVSREGTDIEVNQEGLDLNVSGSYTDTGSVDPSSFTAEGGMSLRGLSISDVNGSSELIRLGSFEVQGMEFKGPGEISTSLARMGDVALLQRLPDAVGKDEPLQVLTLKSLEIKGVALSDTSGLDVEEFKVDSVSVWVLREKEGDLEALRVLKGIMPEPAGAAPGKTSKESEVEEPGPETALSLSLKRFTLTGENSLIFRDLAVDPPFNFTVDSMRANILDVSTEKQGSPVDITLFAGMGKYSALSVQGTAQPPWDRPNVDIRAKLTAMDLPPLTPYTTKYLGYILRSGHLDTDADILVEEGILNSEARIVVNRIVLEAVKEEDEQRAEERLGIPVNTALSLLKDKNDDIKLTLPVEGNTQDPEFKISDTMLSATGLALRKGVTAYYKSLGATLLTGGLIPPGTFSVLGKVFSGATAMTFDPVVFDPLSQDLNEPGKNHLDLMAEKLAAKPEVRLILCGKVTREDIASLRQSDFEAAMAATMIQSGMGTVETVPGPPPSETVSGSLASDAGEALPEGTDDLGEPPVPGGPPPHRPGSSHRR